MGDATDDLDNWIDRLMNPVDFINGTRSQTHFDTWTQLDGKKIKISEMTTNHLLNTINMLKRNNPESKYLPVLKQELNKRNI